MNILIVAEQFLYGGLETRLFGEIRCMTKQNYSVFLACGNIDSNSRKHLNISGILDTVVLNSSLTVDDLLKSVDKLYNYIIENRIDIVHAHPFNSLFPAFLAANKAAREFVLTLHGPASFEMVYGLLYGQLIRSIVVPLADHVFAVSPVLKDLLTEYVNPNNISVAPNSINTTSFAEAEMDKEGPWAIVSRLDYNKIPGVLDFIIKADECKINEIHIYGDGDARDYTITYVTNHVKHTIVRFMGRSDELANVLSHGYAGVAGMGRALLEGASMNLPVILIGYDGVKGLVDVNMMKEISIDNYSGRGVLTVDCKTLENMMYQKLADDPYLYQLRWWIEKNADENIVLSNMFRQLGKGFNDKRDIAYIIFEILGKLRNHEGSYLQNAFFQNALEKALSNDLFISLNWNKTGYAYYRMKYDENFLNKNGNSNNEDNMSAQKYKALLNDTSEKISNLQRECSANQKALYERMEEIRRLYTALNERAAIEKTLYSALDERAAIEKTLYCALDERAAIEKTLYSELDECAQTIKMLTAKLDKRLLCKLQKQIKRWFKSE